MAKIYLQLVTKNFALLGDRIEFPSTIVPRAGEIIDAAELLGPSWREEVTDFIVESVIYKATKGGFAAFITARQWHKGIRSEFLQERGWLLGGTASLSYDEDDPARMIQD